MPFVRFSLLLLAALLAVSAAPLRAQPSANNLVVVDSSEGVPPNLLADDEVARIELLQRGAVTTVPASPVSPDDRSVFVVSDEALGFLDLADGSLRTIPPEQFGPFSPLPLAGLSAFSWLDARTLGGLALNLDSPDPAASFVRLLIDRETLAIRAEPLDLPADTGIVSVAPDLRRFLLVQLPPAPTPGEAAARTTRLRITRPAPAPADALALPDAMRRRAERLLASPAMGRLRLLQDSAASDVVEPTPTRLDLLLFASGGDLRYVTTIPAASLRLGDAWTADSGRLAISLYGLADPQRARPFFDGGLISEEIYRDVTGNLPPAINPILQNNTTYLVEFASGATQILRPAGEAPPLLAAESWSTDNQTLLVKAWHPARLKGRAHPIYTPQFSERSSYRFYDLALREVGRLERDLFSGAAGAATVAQFISPDELIFRAVQGTDRHPFYYNRVSGELRNLADRAGSYWNVVPTNSSRRLVFMYTSFSDPPEVYSVGWDGRALARLTWQNEELRLEAALRHDPVSVQLPGGARRVGVLIQPAAAPFPPRDARIVVWQEGGPGPAMLNRWRADVESPFALLPGMGIALLVMPVAGRPGYTPADYNALADGANFGSVDIDEQAAAVRELIRRGWTSQGKVGITGCSYGGYFAAQSVVRHPDLYAAANVQCGLVDLVTEWTRGYDRLAQYLQGLPPYDIPEEYRRDSPIYNAGRIKAAVLTFHGSEDFLPVVQNENLHLGLVNRGLDARMVKFLGEGHGLLDPENQLYAAQEQLAWFRAHLR